MRKALVSALSFSLLDITKPFHLRVNEYKGIAKELLCQILVPVVYLSKKLYPVTARWPAYLQIVALVAMLVKDLDKLTMV